MKVIIEPIWLGLMSFAVKTAAAHDCRNVAVRLSNARTASGTRNLAGKSAGASRIAPLPYQRRIMPHRIRS
ncbi:MAG: hypothetical protein HRU78_09800 [Gammaproteobacteria bacterium]|nr:MAG: hypothetical protein HRU78_09800 [Gammaproteobacteria bacterium]